MSKDPTKTRLYLLIGAIVAAVVAWNVWELYSSGVVGGVSLSNSDGNGREASAGAAEPSSEIEAGEVVEKEAAGGSAESSGNAQAVEQGSEPGVIAKSGRDFWKPFGDVKIKWEGNTIESVSVPEEIRAMDGEVVSLPAICVLTRKGMEKNENGCTVNNFLVVPPFGVVRCCKLTPVTRYEWTVIVDCSDEPWQIEGEIPNAQTMNVRGRFRIAEKHLNEGLFFIEDAEVKPTNEDLIGDEDICL
ncbi:hypothetical protein STSP2_01184 [Anaerohalosphaera lusitana]|uniref:Uncharacterized protein n=1 Tax=Anaerohalosphaera lusitana TaxID=1936003 RepID=A0A1U9NKB4_9BACT|nr:hypothetical protein [Anaerohalosphaera lusitana]AQT68030.1 hypothetical protein STSP2_01184 [Anaerohalosphaera lusitana]